jgi:hypothetical protein
MRMAVAPDIPTFAEMGLPALSHSEWSALFAPKGTPAQIVGKLNAAAVEALADPAVRSRLADLGTEIFPREKQTPEALAAMQRTDAEKWWPLIKEFKSSRNEPTADQRWAFYCLQPDPEANQSAAVMQVPPRTLRGLPFTRLHV